ncbi:MAG: YbbR-like domain-containing protein [Candidatus Zixiibacteriota bacterium]|nr:MAG: YbbR-like domain-containing protein [candidate division Zixibacteria bacterium]
MVNVFQNFWLKVIALLMGFLVWLHVATEKTYNHQVTLAVTEIDLQDSLTLSRPAVDSVQVEVSATGKQLLRKKWRERGLRINAAQFQPGSHSIILTPANTALAASTGDISLHEIIFPHQIDLEVDRLGTVELPVTPDVEVEADDGFAISRLDVKPPSTVELAGPRSALTRFTTLFTDKKRLGSLRTSISVRVPVAVPAGHGFTVKPDTVSVEIEVVPVKTRVYEDIPVVIFNAPVDEPLTTEPAAVTIELTGPPEDIDLLNRTALTVSADYRERTASGYVPLKIDCPSNFRVKKTSADSARILTAPDADSGN